MICEIYLFIYFESIYVEGVSKNIARGKTETVRAPEKTTKFRCGHYVTFSSGLTYPKGM